MAYRRSFRRGRPAGRLFKRRSRADVQTLSLCGNVILINPQAAGNVHDCLHPSITAIPILTGATLPAVGSQPFETIHAVRGVSFRGSRYQYFARSGAMQGTDPSLSVISTVYMHWVKAQVDPANPVVPLLFPNLIVGNPSGGAGIDPVGDPALDVFHRNVFDIWTRPEDTCEPKCSNETIVSTTDQYSQPMAHNAAHSMPWHRDGIRVKRFLKENETIFLFISVLSGCPADGSFFFFSLDLHGHIAVKTRW